MVAWQKARAYKKFIRDIARGVLSEKKFRLTDQMIRSSRSIGIQISEGHGRYTFKDELNFCVGRGLLNETLNHLYDALDKDYITQAKFDDGLQRFRHVEALLNGYIKYLRTV